MKDIMEDNYLKAEKLLHQLHKIEIEGRVETEEADKLREDMADLWYELIEQEQRSLQQLSEDLYKDYK